MKNIEELDYCIEKLTELLLIPDFKDKKNKKEETITKVNAYRDLIKFFKKIKNSLLE